jgi:hypothetical protein
MKRLMNEMNSPYVGCITQQEEAYSIFLYNLLDEILWSLPGGCGSVEVGGQAPSTSAHRGGCVDTAAANGDSGGTQKSLHLALDRKSTPPKIPNQISVAPALKATKKPGTRHERFIGPMRNQKRGKNIPRILREGGVRKKI